MQFGQQRPGDQALLAVAAILGGHPDFPSERAKFLFAQDVHPPPAADEDDALLRRALGQQVHRRHAVAAGHQQRQFRRRARQVNPLPSGPITLSSSPGPIRDERLGALADRLVEDRKRVLRPPGRC